MPKLTKEIAAGNRFTRSSQNGVVSDSQTRVFRIILSHPGEVVDPTEQCGIKIGDPHPVNENNYCVSFDVQYEGDSRSVFLCTFQYQSTPGGSESQDPKSEAPDIRFAQWTISTSLIEVPVTRWREISQGGVPGPIKDARNPVGDLYEGLTRLVPVTNFVFEQFELEAPSRWSPDAGYVNENQVNFPGVVCEPRTLMFRGVQGRAATEFWGSRLYRGWNVSFEFSYKPSLWDIRVPQAGFNIFNAPFGSVAGAQGAGVEAGSLLLKHQSGKIKGWPTNIEPADGTGAEKTRGMVLVYEYETGGASQLPCAQPIPLNDNGSPRSSKADPNVLVKQYDVYFASPRGDAVFNHVRLP